jgi:hypothetical protein
MRRRPAPAKPSLQTPTQRMQQDRQVKRWIERLLADPNATTDDITPALLSYVIEEVMKRRGETPSMTLFRQAMIDTTPVLAMPTLDKNPTGDMRLLFSLPQMQDLWRQWTRSAAAPRGASFGARGPNASTRGTKAALLTMAHPGSTTDFGGGLAALSGNTGLQEVYRDLMHALHAPGNAPYAFNVPAYSTFTRNAKALLGSAYLPAITANIEMLKELRKIHPEIGKRLLIDGTAIVAWAPQRAPSNALPDAERARIEAEIRKHAPNAAFRMYQYTSTGKVELGQAGGPSATSAMRSGAAKVWRGYLLVAIVCQASGLPIVWTLIPANEYEPHALVPLMSLLHDLWPDIDAELIAGDGLYDDDTACQLCAAHYGIAPIFRHNNRNSADIRHATGAKVFDNLDKQGRPICRKHKKPMSYDGFDQPNRSRLNLTPGQAAPFGQFYGRFTCTTDESARRGPAFGPCGSRKRLQAQLDFSRITEYPHHKLGRPELYAKRKAMEARLNGIESAWQPLKGAHGIGSPGGGRCRIRDIREHEGLISLAFVQRTAAVLWDQLDLVGQAPATLPVRPPQPASIAPPAVAVPVAPAAPVAPAGPPATLTPFSPSATGAASSTVAPSVPRRPGPPQTVVVKRNVPERRGGTHKLWGTRGAGVRHHRRPSSGDEPAGDDPPGP